MALSVVIGREFEQFAHFLIKAHFAGADVADFFQQFVKVIHAPVGIFQAFLVQHKAFFQIARQNLVRPTAELHAAFAAHSKADRQNHFQSIVFDLVLLAVCGSYKEILYN